MSYVEALAFSCLVAVIFGNDLSALGERFGHWIGEAILKLIGIKS